METVINAIPLLSPLTGIGNCIYHTARALLDLEDDNHYTFYYSYFSRKLICPAYPEDEPADRRFGTLHNAKGFLDRHHTVRALARRCAETWHRLITSTRRFDLYYEPNYIPLHMRAKYRVVTVHDLSFHLHPEWHPADRIDYFSKRFVKRLDSADIVTVDSEFTRDELLDLTDIDPERVRVVHLGYDKDVFRKRDEEEVARFRAEKNLPERFVLFVGSIEPRKNINRLLEAYALLPADVRRDNKLVLAGFRGWRNEATMELVRRMAHDVTFLGYLDVDHLALAYNAATVFAYPSLYEGFGLPPLEALACGCPVLASDIPPLREVCAHSAHFVPAEEPEAIAAALGNLLEDNQLRRTLSGDGLARAEAFGWDKTARDMLAVFRELVG